MSPQALTVITLAILTAIGWRMSFQSREARTARLVLVAVALTAAGWLGTFLGPRPVDAAVVPVVMVVWYGALHNGTRLGLFALTPAEDRLNDVLRELTSRLDLNGPDDGIVGRPERLADELATLDALGPDEGWSRVVRLTREYLLALPASGTVRRGDVFEFVMWQVVWWDVHDRRILFAHRVEPERHFEADLRLDRADILRALDARDLDGASRALEHLVARRTAVERWILAQDTLVAALRARLKAARTGLKPDADLRVLAADSRLREVWPAL